MSTNVRFYLSYDIKITLTSHFCRKNVIILSLCTQRCYGRHNVSRKSINHYTDHTFFSCINICRVPRMLFEQEADRPSAQTSSEGPGKC